MPFTLAQCSLSADLFLSLPLIGMDQEAALDSIPVRPHSSANTMIPPAQSRFHHLDALRAFAMLLGIVLHALLSFVDLPIWPAQDVNRHRAYGVCQHLIHGFRMPLFFLISGYFTAMLWQRRGLRTLIMHRLKRILLPLVVGWFAFVPLTVFISIVGDSAKKSLQGREHPLTKGDSETDDDLWTAARTGDLAALRKNIDTGDDINARDRIQLTALSWAVLAGHPECVKLLLEAGADPDCRDGEGNTPLHGAAFLGRMEIAGQLLDAGADVNSVSSEGNTPLDSASADWTIVAAITSMLQLEVTEEEVMSGRAELVPMLKQRGAIHQASWIGRFYRALSLQLPLFFHLWFLYYLLWLVAGFAITASITSRLKWSPLPRWLIACPTCLILLIPLTTAAQYFMTQTFGPDTAAGPIPWIPKLAYYTIFFGFGALCFGRPEFEDEAGRRWLVYFLLALPVFAIGLSLFESRPGGIPAHRLLLSLSAALYAWLAIFGFLGFFRRFFKTRNDRIRYISDASYWIYLAHLPLVIFLQILVMSWPVPSFVKLVGICLVTYGVLLLLYRCIVRYSFIGTMLNGRKVRPRPLPPTVPGNQA